MVVNVDLILRDWLHVFGICVGTILEMDMVLIVRMWRSIRRVGDILITVMGCFLFIN